MDKKFAEGCPRTNILFQKPSHAILFQDGRIVFDDEIATLENLVDVLRRFGMLTTSHSVSKTLRISASSH
jgi:hypothetical protein